MKIISAVVAIIFMMFTTNIKASEEIFWKPVLGFKDKNIKLLVDETSITKSDDVRTGLFLMVFNKEITSKVDDEDIKFKSILRTVMLNCESEFVVVLTESYFAMDLPKNESKSLLYIEYVSISKENTFPIKRSSPIYTTLCPTLI